MRKALLSCVESTERSKGIVSKKGAKKFSGRKKNYLSHQNLDRRDRRKRLRKEGMAFGDLWGGGCSGAQQRGVTGGTQKKTNQQTKHLCEHNGGECSRVAGFKKKSLGHKKWGKRCLVLTEEELVSWKEPSWRHEKAGSWLQEV